MSSAPSSTASGTNRLDRRKARTRQALIDAAVRLIAEGRGDRASIQEITEEADIGFGSFYNHFDSKEQLFETASTEVLERWGRMIDRACAGITDPAEVFSLSLRLSALLGWTHPEVARFITGAGLDLLDAPRRPGAARSARHRGRASRRAVHRAPCGNCPQRRGRRPYRVATTAPRRSRTGPRELGRRAGRSLPAPARPSRRQSPPPGRTAAARHRALVIHPR